MKSLFVCLVTALSLFATVADAQVVVVRTRPRRNATVVVNPPGPGRVVVHDRPGHRRDTVVVNPPGPGRVVIRPRVR